MLKKFVSIALVADAGAERGARAIEKLKAGLTKLGTGKGTRLEVKLKDKAKLKGHRY
jgi:hypothetical protein